MRNILDNPRDVHQNVKSNRLFTLENSVCISIFLFFLAVYTKTLCPTVFWWDSGELIANIKVLGIPHRPGFPIYVLLGKFFSFFPWGSMAFKVNFLSALYASLSLAVLHKTFVETLNLFFPDMVKRKGLVSVSAFTFVLILGFTYSFWIQAVRAEVYSLNVLFFSLLFFLSVRYLKSKQVKFLYLFFFLFGLGLGNHHLSLLSCAPSLLFLLLSSYGMARLPSASLRTSRLPQARHPSWFDFAHHKSVIRHSSFVINLILFFLLGLSIYLYLPIRSSCHPALAWGNVKSVSSSASSIFAIDTIRRFNLDFLSDINTKLSQIILLFSDQLTLVCFTISLLGLFLLFRHNRRLLFFLLLLIAGNCAVVIYMTTEFISTNPDLHGYLIFSIFSLTFLYGTGVLMVLNLIRHGSTSFGFPQDKPLTTSSSWLDFLRLPSGRVAHHKSAMARLPSASLRTSRLPQVRHFFIIVFAVISLFPLFKHYHAANLSRNRIAYNYGLSVISGLDSNSVLFADNVNLNFILRELQYAEGIRKDVTIIDRGLLSFDWYVEQRREEQKALFAGIPHQVMGDPLFGLLLRKCQDLAKPTYIEFTERDSNLVDYLFPKGYVFKVSKTRIDQLAEKDLLSQKRWDSEGPFDPEDEIFQRDWDAQRVFALSYFRLGLFYEWKGMTSYALDKYSKVSQVDPENEELLLKIKHLEALQNLSETSHSAPILY